MSEKHSSLPTGIIEESITAFDLNKGDSVILPIGDLEITDPEDEVVRCMYCPDLISDEVLEAHLARCPRKAQLRTDSLEEITNQIEQLESFLKCNPEIRNGNSSEMLKGICYDILKGSKLTCETIKTALDNLKEILCRQEQGKYMKHCIERLVFLSEELISILQEVDKNSTSQSYCERIKQYKKNLTLNVNPNAKDFLRDKKEGSKSLQSDFTNRSSEKHSIARTQQESNCQKYFYALCIQGKQFFGENDPAQTVHISRLFEKAQELDIPAEDWKMFIFKELKRPINWEIKANPSRVEVDDIFMTSPVCE